VNNVPHSRKRVVNVWFGNGVAPLCGALEVIQDHAHRASSWLQAKRNERHSIFNYPLVSQASTMI
jgi:hypothetical protein